MAKALLVTGGKLHHFAECGRILADAIEADGRFEVTLTQTLGVLTDKRLSAYDLVVLYAQHDKLSPKREDALTGFVRRGGGFVGIHCATAGFQNNQKYVSMIGARFAAHGPLGEFGVSVADDSHYITKRLSEFHIEDELYLLDRKPKGASVLLTAHWRGDEAPVLYTKTYGKGRVVYFALGHDERAFNDPVFRQVVLRSMRWVTGAREGRKRKFGIIGYGAAFNMGRAHADLISKADGLSVSAVCDSDPARVKQAQADWKGIAGYTSLTKMLEGGKVDAAIIVTPHNTHYDLAMQCMKAGVGVVCEKPFCITAAEAQSMVETARENDVLLTVFHNRRLDGDYLTIRRLVDTGVIGDVFHVEAFMGHFGFPGTWWRANKAVSGGAFYDWGAHFIDWILGIMRGRSIENVTGFFHNRVWAGVTNEDQTTGIIRFTDGSTAEMQLSFIAHSRKARWRILGTKGAIVDWGQGALEVSAPVSGLRADAKVPYLPGRAEMYYRNLADHMLQGEPILVSSVEAGRVIAVIETAEKSSAAAQALPVPEMFA